MGAELRALRPEPAGRFRRQFELQRRNALRHVGDHRSRAASGCGICRSARARASRRSSTCRCPSRRQYFLLPHVQFGARNVDVLSDQQRIAEYRVRSFDYGLDFGREFGNWGEIRTGVRREQGSSRVRDRRSDASDRRFRCALGTSRGFAYDRARRRQLSAPRHDCFARMARRAHRSRFQQPADQLSLDWLAARIVRPPDRGVLDIARHDARRATPPTCDAVPARRIPQSLRAEGRLAHRPAFWHRAPHVLSADRPRRPGFLDVPAYIGVSLEAGNVWESRSEASLRLGAQGRQHLPRTRHAARARVPGDRLRGCAALPRSICFSGEPLKRLEARLGAAASEIPPHGTVGLTR